jgi:Bacterial Ig domain
MIDHRATPGTRLVRRLGVAAVVLAAAAIAGCARNADDGSGASRLRVYAADLTGGAKVCDVPKIDPAAGKTTAATIKLENDGGWCGIRVYQDGHKPFGAGLLTTRPSHGAVTIHVVGDDTRIDYTPDRRFAGTDTFTVRLVPGDASVQVTATVTTPTS